MDSANGEMSNLAQSAEGRNTTNDQQITKLKEDHQKEIQKLTYESKIELMESQMKIVNLEKDNQTLSHQLEMLKLKNSYEIESKQIDADNELQNKNVELHDKLNQMEREMTAKENEYKLKIKDLENENKTKQIEKTTEMIAKENRSLKRMSRWSKG